MQVPLKKCNKPDCKRQTTDLSSYCCDPCAMADRNLHEVEEHSQGCDIRHATRGDWIDPDLPPTELPISETERARHLMSLATLRRRKGKTQRIRPMSGWPDSTGRDELWW